VVLTGPRNRTGVDQAASWLFPPIKRTSLQLPTKTDHFKAVFQCFSRVRSTEPSEFMERATGIELYSQILSLNNARRCRHSKSQLVPNGAAFVALDLTETESGNYFSLRETSSAAFPLSVVSPCMSSTIIAYRRLRVSTLTPARVM